MSATLTFDESAADLILQQFGKDVDDEGYVIDQQSGVRETYEDDDPIHIDHFAGVENGSIIILDDDFNTLIDHVKRQQNK